MPKFPTITDATLVPIRAIEVQLKEHPNLLDQEDCPYPPPIKNLLRRLAGQEVVVRAEYSEEDLEREITELYSSLRVMPVKGDAKDTINLYKTQADLLARLVDLKAKALGVRDMARFQRTVVEILDGLVTPAQRNEFLEKLGKHVR